MKGVKGKKGWFICALAAVALACGSIAGGLIYREVRLNELQKEALQELEGNKGEYAEQTLVLYDTSPSEAKALAERFGATLRITGDGKFATLTLQNGTTVEDVYAARANRKYLPELSLDYKAKTSETAEEEPTRKISRPDYTVTDTYYALQGYLDYLNIASTWNTTKGSGVTVAVIDTGIDTDHPEFTGKISEYSYNATEDKIVKDYTLEDGGYDWSLIEDEQGHGTAVAGTIAAAMDGNGTVGIASEVNLLVIKAECDENGGFYSTSDLVFGLYYAIERDVDVVNMSFGGYSIVNPYATATKLAVESDIVCVAAAGNDGTTQLCYPAADENVLGVGALAENGWELASYSNYGENVDLVAPGTVYTTKKGGGYGLINGTSFASPITAGAVALYLSQNRYQTFANVQELLYASCYDLGSLGQDWDFGYGALDIGALICEEKGTVTFDYLTDEIEETTQVFVRNHTLQNLPEPERNYAVFDGWYYDIHCTEELNWYEDEFTTDLTLYAKWANEEDGVPYTYVTKEDGTVEIRSYTGHRRYITIPDKIDGKPVTSIGDFAFDGQTRLRQVNLPESLTYIGRYAFRNCNNLVEIAIPDGVTAIGEYAFYNNVRLSGVAFTDGSALAKIGNFAFSNCGSLSRFELPGTVASVNGSAFFGATSLKAIQVKEGNKAFLSDGGVLFNNTASVLVVYPAGLTTEYSVPANVRSIGDYAFGYAKLKTVNLGNVLTVGAYAFSYSSLESVTLPDSVTNLGMGAFSCAFNLKNATLGKGLTSIPKEGFASCYSLARIEIPANIREIGTSAFAGDVSLTEVAFASGSSLVQIGMSAFAYANLRSVELPASLVVIGSSAFSYNYALSEVTFEKNSNLQVIGGNAFYNAVSLTEIELPAHLMQIGEYAFQSSGLTEVALPASLNYLGAGAFASCHSLVSIEVESGNTHYTSVNGVVYDGTMSEVIAYPAGNPATVYAIENTVTAIGEAAFYGAWNLTSVTLPQNLETVKSYGFYDCESITDYALPETLTYIEAYAFSENYALGRNGTTLNIPDNVIQISNYAFAEDYNLHYINFTENSRLPRISYAAFAYTGLYSFRVPASVSTMAQYAFAGCNNLTSITFAANGKLASISAYMFQGCDNLTSVTFENGSALTSIQAHGFEGMRKLQTVDFGDAKLTNIDNYAFRYCDSLQTLTLPDGVTYIGRYAFFGDKALTRLDLPTSVEYVGQYAFYGAESLNVYFKAETLPLYLQENWDAGINGYFVGVADVTTNGDWSYAVLTSGKISLIKYTGMETALDLTALDLGGEITQIGGYCFYNTAVESVILPETLTSIQQYAFARSKIKTVAIPGGTEFIGKYAFFNTPLESVTFAEEGNLKTIEQYAFYFTKSLQGVTLPASLTTMGSYAFYQSGITAVAFAENSAIEVIPEHAFASTKITSVVLPDSVVTISDNAFRDCESLASVTFGKGEGLQVRSNAFYNTGLTELYIPENLEYIGEYAFVGLRNLTAFSVSENNPYYSANDGLLYSKDGKKLIAVPAGRTGSLVLPESLENIGFGAFENTSLSEITFDENSNILTFGYRAFYNAQNLTSFTVPASVVSIDYYAFAMCENLETVTFAEGSKLTGVYEGAFYGCKSLKNITLPDGIVEISDFAFYGCSSLTRLPISQTSELKGIYDYAFAYTGITELTVPDTVIDIGAYAFRGARLKSVVIPDTNKELLIIGIGAFADCNDLVGITLPFIGASFEDTEITWFGYIFGAGGYQANATYVPESLKTVTITEGITFVGTGAFCFLTSLETLNIPFSISSIYYGAFCEIRARYELKNTIEILYSEFRVPAYAGSVVFGTGVSGEIKLKNISTIPNGLFSNCDRLTSIKLPYGITNIEGYTFNGCSSLTNINIPDSVTSIGDSAFNGCSSLTNINIPDSVTSIGNSAFYGCSSLTNINIPDGVTSIGSCAFSGCGSLTNINIPDGVKNIGRQAFYECSLTNVVIPSGVICIWSGAFDGCSSLLSVEIPEGVISIESYAFYGCSSLTSIVIPEGMTSIGEYAFSGCDKLYKVNNQSDITFSIGGTDNGYITYHAKLLIDKNGNKTYLDDASGFEYIDTADGFRFLKENDEYKLIAYLGEEETVTLPESINGNEYAVYQMRGVQNVIIPDNFTTINEDAFYGSDSLISIKISNSVVSIEDHAFYDCKNLENILFEENSHLTHIGYLAFYFCGLTSLKIPNGVEEIGETFINCLNLKNIEIPESVTSIVTNPFSGCPVESIIIGENNNAFKEIDGVVYNKALTRAVCATNNVTSVEIPATVTDISSAFSGKISLKTVSFEEKSELTNIGAWTFSGCSGLTSITIPDGVKNIGSFAFFGCSSLTSIVIPDGVTSIGDYTFYNCSRLKSVLFEINSQLISIGDYAFDGCSSLVNIEIPSRVTSIGSSAFYYCSSLTSITVPESVTLIGTDAFVGCELEKIIIDENNTSFKEIDGIVYDKALTRIIYVSDKVKVAVIPATVTSISSVFCQKKNLTVVAFEEKSELTNIGAWAFSGCSGLTSITIPDSVTSIESYAFQYCSSLTSVTFGENSQLTRIDDFAFDNCSGLTSIEIPSKVASIGTSITSGAFCNCSRLYKIVNYSSYLSLEDYSTVKGTTNYGRLFYCVKEVVDKLTGNTYTLEEGFSYIDTADGFRFMVENGEYKLIAYLGNEDTVTLPQNINGNAYTIYEMRGVKNVIIPDNFTEINMSAFSYCSSLTSVIFGENSQLISIGYGAFFGCRSLTYIDLPDSLTNIENDAFSLCSQLKNIKAPDSVKNIGVSAFHETAYYNDPNNWIDGMLYIGNALIRVSADAKYALLKENTTCIADGAFSECYSLVEVKLGGNHDSLLSSLTNLETLVLTELPTEHSIYNYFGWDSSAVPITLKNIVLKKGCDIRSANMFENLTGVTIYVEEQKTNVMWDTDFPGWNNGNKVYYGGEWIEATFYDSEGEIISNEYYTTSQVIRQPYLLLANDGQYSEVLLGWDLDGDGIADSVPATSTKNISARAVIQTKLNEYTVNFYDKDGITVLYSYILPYGSTFELPAEPTKRGYTFLGWQGYTEGMVVTGDIALYSEWQHDGEGHNYVKTTVAPTCTEEGYDLYTCEICGESYKENIVEATGHAWTEWIIDEEAACESKGSRHRICEVCGERENEEIEALGHSYIGEITKEPTCTEYGEMTYTCEHCGDVIIERLDMTEHNYVKKVVSKTWLQWLVERLLNIFFGYEGTQGYYFECTECRHIQTSEEAMLLTSAQGSCAHESGDWVLVKEANCEEQGIYGRYCTKCGELIEAYTVDALGHDYSIVTVVDPTCVEKGYTLHNCSRCDDYYATDFVDATGHTAGEWIIDTQADCTHAGSKHTECTICGIILEIAAIPASGHSYGEIQTVDATCTEDGYTYHVCEVCGYEERLSTIPATGHTPGELVTENRVEATCTTDGSNETVVYCSICGEKLSRVKTTIPATGHTASEWILDVEADCTHAESKHTECTVCGTILEIAEIPATGHTARETVTENSVEATCTTDGSYETVVYCTVCGEELSRVKTTIPATGHLAGEWIIDTQADCIHAGSKHTECTDCGTILEIAEIPAIGHNYGEIQTVEATCTKDGYTYHVCEVCGYEEKLSTISANGHTASEAVIENRIEATCTTDGSYETVVYCTICGEELSREKTVISETGHTAGEWIIDTQADCTHTGSKHTECTVCGTILEIAEIPASGHSYGEIQTVEATCTEDGYTYHVCEDCGNEERLSVIPANGHTECEAVIENRIEATCTTNGSYETVVYCTVCGEELSREKTMISATGHTAGDWIIDTQADCTHAGSKHTECTVCGTILEIAEIPAIGHEYDYINIVWSWSEDYSKATATVKCIHDKTHTKEISAVITSVTKEATETEDGETVYTATVTVDGKTFTDRKTVKIPAKGPDSENKKSGCGSMIDGDGMIVGVALVVLALAVVVYRKRKRG